MEDRTPDLIEYEKYYARLTDPLQMSGHSYDGTTWWLILIPILVVGAIFIAWMYVKDSRSIRWYFAVPLGLLRATVYGLLAYMFLLPTLKETRIWKPRTPPELTRHSRVVVLIDVSDSVKEISDSPSSAARRQTRLERVIDYLSDENVAFFKKLVEKNPVYVYRFATGLDAEVNAFTLDKSDGPDGKPRAEIIPFTTRRSKEIKGQEEPVLLERWTEQDWLNFARYADFKPWLLRGLTDEGAKAIRADYTHEPGGLEWAQAYLAQPEQTILDRVKLSAADANVFSKNVKNVKDLLLTPNNVGGADLKTLLLAGLSPAGQTDLKFDFPFEAAGVEWAQTYLSDNKIETILARVKLSDEDAARFKGNFENMKDRLSVARTIAQGTDVTDSVQRAFEAQKDSMLEAIIVFSDGRSNIGVDARARDDVKLNPALENLHRAAKREQIPIFTVGIGEHREIKSVRITGLQAPSQTPPDDPFKIIVDVDGENMKGAAIDVFLEVFLPETDLKADPALVLPGRATFEQGEPPTGQFEWTINPPEIVKRLGETMVKLENGKSLPEGVWHVRAFTAKVNEEGKPDPNQRVRSELMPIRIERKSVRILLMASVANRDFQYLLTQLIRDKAEVSVVLQNDAGMFLDGKSIAFLDDKFRHLSKFPDRLRVEEIKDEPAETKWYNLARYDVIIAFDPDWTLLTEEQASLIRTWVDLQAGGLLHVAGPINSKKLTFNENDSEVQRRLAPLLEIFPVTLGDNVLSKPRQDRNVPRRLEFPGAAPEMEFLRLDDDKPDNPLSGWEQFFTGKETREQGLTAELKRGFYDYYPVKDIKAGATIVARYLEPQASENTFDKKDPPYIVTYKFGQGVSVFLGSSEIWRFNQYKDVYRERFWVKMSRYLASGSRRKQNVRGRILMASQFTTGDTIRATVQLLDASLKGLPANQRPAPRVFLRPVEIEADAQAPGKKDGPIGDPDKLTAQGADYLRRWTIELELTPRKSNQNAQDGYFELKKILKAVELTDGRLLQAEDPRLKLEAVEKLIKGPPRDFPVGTWRLEAPIPESSESLSSKFIIRKALPPELVDVRPDMISLAAISSETDELKPHTGSNKELIEKLRKRAFSTPSLDKPRLAFRFDDRESIDLIPEVIGSNENRISNPQVEPEIRKIKIEPIWFDGPALPRWMTSWYDRVIGQSEQTHTIALWMLVCISLLSLEWLTRKLLKIA